MNEAQITQQVWDEYWHSREIFGNSSPIYHNEDTLYANLQSALEYLSNNNEDADILCTNLQPSLECLNRYSEDALYARYQSALEYLRKNIQPLYHLVLEFFTEHKLELIEIIISYLADHLYQIPDETQISLLVLVMVIFFWQKKNRSKNNRH